MRGNQHIKLLKYDALGTKVIQKGQNYKPRPDSQVCCTWKDVDVVKWPCATVALNGKQREVS